MKILRLEYSTTVVYRANLPTGSETEMARAVEECLTRSGLTHGRTGMDPESIRFTIEEDRDADG